MTEEMIIPQLLEESPNIPDVLPVLTLRNLIVYPYVIVPLSVSREQSLQALDIALEEGRVILLLAQKDTEIEDPEIDDLYQVGMAALVMRILKLPDGRVRALVQGLQRARVESYVSESQDQLKAKIELLDEPFVDEEDDSDLELNALLRSVKETLEKVAALGKDLPQEILLIAFNLDSPGRLADLVASNLGLKMSHMQEILEIIHPIDRLKRVNDFLLKEIDLLEVQQRIVMEARDDMDKNQREFYLRQQLKIIQDELGEDDELSEELQIYRDKIANLEVPEDAFIEIEKNISKLERMHPDSSETSVVRAYLEWMTDMPWGIITKDNMNLKEAKKVLDADHYGLEKIKDSLIEYLAVCKLNPEQKGTILCFVGPPGTGKTSLGRSIAKAMGRKFVRISLGGVRDESEIRGHRKTYVGAMPGRIIQALHQAGSMNPIIMLDEVDKIGRDFRGDPSAALLEVLDPEQNHAFSDRYMNMPVDLSNVLFLTNANELDPIQPAFKDRMSIVQLSSYTLEEKVIIACRHLVPKQLVKSGINESHVKFTTKGIQTIIAGYTKESGLRQLEREIGAVCRKIARKVAENNLKEQIVITNNNIWDFLGPIKMLQDERLKAPRVGVATGLAWTPTGGEVLFVEGLRMPGKGKLILTGQLGSIMKESAQAALSYIKSCCEIFGISNNIFPRLDLHIHFPEGATQKDGPSAGLAIATVLLSAIKGIRINNTFAMTGEIDLRGEALAIGGLKEKILAALRVGIKNIIIPFHNQKDLEEIAPSIRKRITFYPVRHIEEVFKLVFFSGSMFEIKKRIGVIKKKALK